MKNSKISVDKGKRKIGIISLYGWLKIWDNYGTLLQNFALQTHLQKKGYETFWIRTQATPPTDSAILTLMVRLFNELRTTLRILATPILGPLRSKELAKFNKKHPRFFKEFMTKYTPTTAKEYTWNELITDPPEVDALITGSDQIWKDVNEINFLGFGEKKTKRIAYAVSAPWPALNEEWLDSAIKFVPNFDAIAVRENEGIDICRKLGRTDAIHAMDPVLLLDSKDYLEVIRKEVADQKVSQPFIYGYFVNLSSLEQIPWQASLEYAKSNQLKIKAVPMQGAELVIPESNVYVPTPAEWMNGFFQSEAVLTNSYHGALFAIVMNKPFLVFMQEGIGSHQNGRFTSALTPLGLEDRLIKPETWKSITPEKLSEYINSPINWKDVNDRVEIWRKSSEAFLEDALP